MQRISVSFLFLLSQIWIPSAHACSAFAGGGRAEARIMGKSYDWLLSHGIALVNKRGVEKSALVSGSQTPARWVSKYGSVTYTQFGREFPISGLNEKGLAVEILWDYDNEGPDGKGPLPALNEAQWIQYQLDMSASVADAVANARRMKIKKVYADVHYMACDKTGACATFEFRKDKVVINQPAQGGMKTLTNSDYGRSAVYARDYIGFGGKKTIPWGSYKSEDRFVILNARLQELNAVTQTADAIRLGFEMLLNVRNVNTSVWNIVYDLNGGVSHFKKMFEPKKVMRTELARLDFSCKTPVKILDLESGLDGDVTDLFRDYDPELNRSTVEYTGSSLGIGKNLQQAVIDYPATTRCTE